jgi:LysM repeat protein
VALHAIVPHPAEEANHRPARTVCSALHALHAFRDLGRAETSRYRQEPPFSGNRPASGISIFRGENFMQPIIVRPCTLNEGGFRTNRIMSLVALLALTTALQSMSAQTPAPAPSPTPVRKPAPTLLPPPAPVEGEVTHVVKKGDTLWDIARAYLKDPFKWPEVFQRNTDVVENPHWIYPGEVIRIPNSEVRPEVLAELRTRPAPEPTSATAFDRTVFSTIPGLVSDRLQSNGEVIGRARAGAIREGEVEAAPFADREGGPRGAGRLAAAYDRPGIDAKASDQRFQLRDPIFAELPKGRAPKVGDRYLTYVQGPDIGDDAQLMIPTAIVRVESFRPGELTLVRVMRQFGEVTLDQLLVPLETAVPSSSMSPSPVSNGGTAKVLWVHQNPVLPSVQSYVLLSAEPGNTVRVGDQFTLMDATVDELYPAPPVPAAVAQVVKVTPYAITALVVDHDQPTIRAGMPAQLTARMR